MRKFPHRQMCVLMKCHGHSASSLAFHKSSSCGILIGHIWSMFTAPWKVNCTLQSACKTVSFPVLPGPLLSKPATLSFVTHYSHAPPATGWQLVSHMPVRITASTWHNSIPESHGTCHIQESDSP